MSAITTKPSRASSELFKSGKVLGLEHPDTAKTLDALGTLYYQMGSYAKAEKLFVHSLDIREKALGPEHPVTADS